jgi:hypothetical protein
MSALSGETLPVSGVLPATVFGSQARGTARCHQENQRLAGLEVRRQMIGQGCYAIVQSFSVDHPGRGVPDRRPAAGARHGHLRGHRLAFTTPRTRL